MKTVVVYEAKDGSRWDHQVAAGEREALLDEISAFLVELGVRPRPEDIKFKEGHGYLQHPEGTRAKMQVFLTDKKTTRDTDGPLGILLNRLWCLDGLEREWGQGYFVLHPWRAPEMKAL